MKFNYQARTKEGETQTGTVEAGTREAAVETLQRHDLVVVFLEKVSDIPIYVRSLKFFQKIKNKEITIFYRQLAILFEANISPLDALKGLKINELVTMLGPIRTITLDQNVFIAASEA